MAHRDWLGLKEELPERLRLILTVFSFVFPLLFGAQSVTCLSCGIL